MLEKKSEFLLINRPHYCIKGYIYTVGLNPALRVNIILLVPFCGPYYIFSGPMSGTKIIKRIETFKKKLYL